MSTLLNNRKAVITGGGSGIGLAVAERFLSAGAEVVICGRNRDKLGRAVEKLGPGSRAIGADVSSEEEMRNLFEQVGELDFLVTCAGGALFGPVEKVPLRDVRALFDVRFFGQLSACRMAIPRLKPGGAIILCAGIADKVGLPFFSAGSAVDGAVNALVRALAVELAPRQIRVNSISPGLIRNTEIQSNMSGGELQGFVEGVVSALPLKRPGEPAEVAEAAFFLATSSYVTGHVLEVDGGWVAR